MEVVIEDLQKTVHLNPTKIGQIVKIILQNEGIQEACISIVFVSRQKMQSMNKKYLERHYATDVLAFDLSDGRSGLKSRVPKNELVGDIVISTDAAVKNSQLYKTLLHQELTRYMIHGILHLLGYDDHKPNDIKKMRKKEERILNGVAGWSKKVIG